MAEIDSLTIRIKAETGSAVAQLKQVTQLVEKLNSVASDNAWKSFAKGFSKLGKASENVEKLVASLKKLEDIQVSSQLQNLGNAIKSVSNAANSASRTVKKLDKAAKDNGADKFAKKWTSAVKTIETVNKELSKMGSELYGAFKSTGILADLDGMTGAISKNIPVLGELTSAWKSAASQIKSIVLSNASVVDKASQIILVRVSTLVRALYSIVKLPFSKAALGSTKGIISMISMPLKNLANNITDVTKRWKKFTSSLSRIAIYRLIRSALKEISKAMKEGVQNLYQWGMAWRNTYSSAAKFVDSMDRLATAFLYLKNSIGAMVSPLIDTVAPVIDALVDKFVALTNAINQAMAALSGAGVWRRALKYQYTYAEAANLTTKALKRTVLAFDELNKLDDPNKGGSGSDLDYSKMFEEVPVDDWLARILDSSSWRILGTGIADKINEALANLNWSSIKSSARIWASRFGSFLDGMFMGISMPLLGKSIAEGLNTVALSINTFFRQFHFEELGKNLSTGFTSFINNLAWDDIGTALTQKWKAMFELLIGFKDVDLSGLGSGIVTMFVNAIENLPINELVDAIKTLMPKLGTEIGIAIGGMMSEVNNVFNGGRSKTGGLDAKGLGESFSKYIENALAGIDPKEAGIFLSNGIKKIIEFATGALKTLPFEEMKSWVSTAITSMFENIDLKQGVQNAVDIATKIVELLTTAINAVPWEDVGDALESADTSGLKEGIKGLFKSVTDALERSGFMDEVATGIATYFGLKLGGAVAKYLPTILTAKMFSSGAGAGATAAGGGILGSILGIGGGGATAGAVLGQQFSHHVLGPLLEGFGSADAELYKNWTFFGEGGLFQASLDNAKFKIEDFETYLSDFGTTHKSVFDNITSDNNLMISSYNLLTSAIQGDSEGVNESINSIRDTFALWGDAWAAEHPLISAGFDAIYDTVANSQIASAWSGIMSSLQTETNSILSKIEERFGTAFNFLTGGIKDLINGANDLNDTLGKGVRTSDPGKITRRASGGTVDKGDLFLAGESGPEIVTSYGGDTAVMNMDQIISSISASVAAASGGDIAIPIYLDGNMLDQIIVTAQQRQNIRSGGR